MCQLILPLVFLCYAKVRGLRGPYGAIGVARQRRCTARTARDRFRATCRAQVLARGGHSGNAGVGSGSGPARGATEKRRERGEPDQESWASRAGSAQGRTSRYAPGTQQQGNQKGRKGARRLTSGG